MRLLKRVELSDGSFEFKLSVDSTEDLWHLYNFIIVGDAVRTKTRRKINKENEVGLAKIESRTLTLEVEVKQIHFSPDEIRVHGVIRSECEFVRHGSYHTLTIQCDSPQVVTVIKRELTSIDRERLNEACSKDSQVDTAAVLMNYGDAQLVLVTPSIIYSKATIGVNIAKKHRNDGTARDRSIHRFFEQTLNALITNLNLKSIKLILLCSPGNVRLEFMQYLQAQAARSDYANAHLVKEIVSISMPIRVNSATSSGLREALRDDKVSSEMKTTRYADDIQVWDSFQSMMNQNPDRCVYTPQFVYHAALNGAIKTLMISDAVFRDENPAVRYFFLSLVHFVRQSCGGYGRGTIGTTTTINTNDNNNNNSRNNNNVKSSNNTTKSKTGVHIFSSAHVTGEQLAQLGNIAALLRFDCPELDEMEIIADFVLSEEAAAFVRANPSTRVSIK